MDTDQARETTGTQATECDLAAWKSRATIYRAIIERYKPYISEQEQKNIPTLKALVSPEDASIQAAREKITGAIEQAKADAAQGRVVETKELKYDYDNDFLDAAKAAFEKVKGFQKTNSETSVSFWLTYAEMDGLGIADPFDRALYLCSLLAALGCKRAKVCVLGLDDGSTHPVVTFEYGERNYLLDATDENAMFGELEADSTAGLVAGYKTADGKAAVRVEYSFNKEEYEEAEEE